MNTRLMIATAREFAAIAHKRFPEVADCDFREKFMVAILTAVADETVMVELHEDDDDLI